MTNAFGAPAEPKPGGDFIRLDDLHDRLLLIQPKSVEVVPSKQFDKDGNPKPDYKRITADVVVLDGRSKIGGQTVTIPHVIRDMWISGGQLVGQIEGYVGNAETPYALGRLGKGEPNSFGTAPRILEAFDADDAKVATEYLTAQAPAL
jgi:hypothetical protein